MRGNYTQWNLLHCVSWSKIHQNSKNLLTWTWHICSEECSDKGGTNEGSCASGFGVCCVRKHKIKYKPKSGSTWILFQNRIRTFNFITVTLACGGTTSDNNTYIVQTTATTVSSPCTHTICPASTNICRIRYDFTTFVTAGPQTGTGTLDTGTALSDASQGACFSDSFVISGKMSILLAIFNCWDFLQCRINNYL